MKIKKYLVLILAIILFSNISLVNASSEYIEGQGEAILGSGMTIEQAEEIAFQNAQRDAISKFGVYIESETVVEDYTLVKDKITSITAGTIKVKEDSKEVESFMEDDVIRVVVEATFIIDRADFEERIEQYIERQNDDEIEEVLAEINQLEEKLEEYSTSQKEVDVSEIEASLDELKGLYQRIDNELEVSGDQLVSNIEEQRLERLKGLKSYLEELKTVANPYDMFQLSIDEELKVSDKGEGKVEIGVPLDLKLNNNHHKQALQILKKYENVLYPKQGEIDNINQDLLGNNPIEAPLLLVFLDEDDYVVSFYSENHRGGNQGIRTNLNFYLHNESASNHDSLMKISYRDIATDDKNDSVWIKELPEEVVNEIERVNIIFSKKSLGTLRRKYNYDHYYSNSYTYTSPFYHRMSYVYSDKPIKFSDIKFTEADILEKIDGRINNVELKIAELKGEELESETEVDRGIETKFNVGTNFSTTNNIYLNAYFLGNLNRLSTKLQYNEIFFPNHSDSMIDLAVGVNFDSDLLLSLFLDSNENKRQKSNILVGSRLADDYESFFIEYDGISYTDDKLFLRNILKYSLEGEETSESEGLEYKGLFGYHISDNIVINGGKTIFNDDSGWLFGVSTSY